MLLAIPTDREGLSKHIVNACRELKVDHAVVNIYAADWMVALQRLKPTGCIYIPEFRFACWRELFGERIRFINQQMGIPVYPRLHELELYESKRRMAYWLESHQITASTHVDFWQSPGGVELHRARHLSADL